MNQVATTKSKDWRVTLDQIAPSFADALPAHVTVDRFKRILSNAISTDGYIQNAVRENPKSVWNAAMACAKDGLIPDGREAALVVFNTKVKCSDGITRSLATAQYMPMIGGILKMMRQSGEVASLSAQVVYEKDEFDYELGDNERISHKPSLTDDRGKMIAAYAILKTKDGGIYREMMGRQQIMAVKQISKAKDSGPWSGPFESEMWKKTVLRRLAKRAPLSTDVLDLIQRDDGMYELPATTNLSPDEDAPAPPARAALDLSTGIIDGDYEAEEVQTPSEALDGDGIPGEDEAPKEKPKSKPKTEAKKAEPEPEPEKDAEPPQDEPEQAQGDEPYPTKKAAMDAINNATSVDQIDEILDACWGCESWIGGKGAKTTIAMKADDRRKVLEG